MTPNDICYTHRSIPCSVIIKEASFWSRWTQVQRPTFRHYSGEKNLETLSSKFVIHIKLFPLKALGTPLNRQKEYMHQKTYGASINQCPLNHLSKAYMNSYRQKRETQVLHGDSPGSLHNNRQNARTATIKTKCRLIINYIKVMAYNAQIALLFIHLKERKTEW